MNLDKYRVPSSATVGEWITLPDSDGARFLVKLPSAANREWQCEVMQLLAKSGAGVRLDEKGDVQREAIDAASAVRWQEARLEAFHRLCVVEGPPGFALDELLYEYYPALQKLFDLAQQRAEEEEAHAETVTGES